MKIKNKLIRSIFNLDAVDELKQRDAVITQQKIEDKKLEHRNENVMLCVRELDNAAKAIEDAVKKDWAVDKSPADLLRDLNDNVGVLSAMGYDLVNQVRIGKVKTAAIDAMKAAYAKNPAEKIVRDDFAELRYFTREVSDIWTDNALIAAAHEVLNTPEEEWDVVDTPGDMLEMLRDVHEEIGFEFQDIEEIYPTAEEENTAETEVEASVEEEDENVSPYSEEETILLRTALEKIMVINGRQEETLQALNIDHYKDIAGPSPELVDLWRDYANEFDKTEGSSINDLAGLTPDAQAHVGKLSKDGLVYTGKVMGSRDSFPLAEKDDEAEGGINYNVGCFKGNKQELLERIDDTYPEDSKDENHQKYRTDYLTFVAESEQMLLKPQADTVSTVEEPKLI